MYKLAYPHRHVQRKILAIGHCFQRYLENVEVGILAGEKSMEAVLFLHQLDVKKKSKFTSECLCDYRWKMELYACNKTLVQVPANQLYAFTTTINQQK